MRVIMFFKKRKEKKRKEKKRKEKKRKEKKVLLGSQDLRRFWKHDQGEKEIDPTPLKLPHVLPHAGQYYQHFTITAVSVLNLTLV